MPKITVTFDIPENKDALFQKYDNILACNLTQDDQYAIRNLLEESLDRNAIDYKNPTENTLIGLLNTVINQQRPDDKRSFLNLSLITFMTILKMTTTLTQKLSKAISKLLAPIVP